MKGKGYRWQVWRGSELSGSFNERDSYRWRWMARYAAWRRTRVGWATYFVKDRDEEERFAKQVLDYAEDACGMNLTGLRGTTEAVIRSLDPPRR